MGNWHRSILTELHAGFYNWRCSVPLEPLRLLVKALLNTDSSKLTFHGGEGNTRAKDTSWGRKGAVPTSRSPEAAWQAPLSSVAQAQPSCGQAEGPGHLVAPPAPPRFEASLPRRHLLKRTILKLWQAPHCSNSHLIWGIFAGCDVLTRNSSQGYYSRCV